MKRFLSVIALVLMLCMVASMMFACDSDSDKDDDKKKENSASKEDSEKEDSGKENKPVNENNNVVNATFDDSLILEKIGVINSEYSFMVAPGGLYYKDDNGLYGIMSPEGLYDTGALYYACTDEDKYFKVYTKEVTSMLDYDGLNSVMLLDCRGKQVIPGTYAGYDVINDRFVKAFTASSTGIDSSDSLLHYYGDDWDAYYRGEWVVYDLTTGATVPGAAGTDTGYITGYGNYISFYDADDNRIVIDGSGNPLPEDARLFDDGSYSLEGKVGDVYATDGTKLFSYDLTGYIPNGVYGDYYSARMYTEDGTKYAVMDKTGKVVSAEFNDYFDIEGELIFCENKVYNFAGDNVLPGDYSSMYYDEIFGNSWLVRNDDIYTMIDVNGNVYFDGPFDDDHAVYSDEFVAYEKKDSDYYFYSHKDQDYTIKGYSVAPWLVKAPANNYRYDLVDTMTGEKLLEGYSEYSDNPRNAQGYFLYARYEGGADVFLVTARSQLAELTQKKEDLFADLAAAFAAEGLNATINKETGEISLDASVMFGGDSAVLTDAGKEFLNKFIKVYAEVASSDKYVGFITKTMVEGHTAPVAGSSFASDFALSTERAENVMNYCLSSETGIDASALANTFEAVGYSNSQPVYAADGSVDMAASRRVSFRFLVNIDYLNY